MLGELEYEDGELADASEACRGVRRSYSIAEDGPVGMAMEEDMAWQSVRLARRVA